MPVCKVLDAQMSPKVLWELVFFVLFLVAAPSFLSSKTKEVPGAMSKVYSWYINSKIVL